mmetsp:Transcript_3623/g.13837  ORF Transcript_3623/g.13837 Transcript_3623/m.13837 type:complete len:251 (+) Transcript_3623:127-879(+)
MRTLNSLCLALVRNCLHLLFHLFLIGQIVVLDWFQLIVQLVHKRHSCWNIQLENLLGSHLVEVLHQGTQAVSVCHNQHVVTVLDLRCNGVIPVWKKSLRGEFQRLCIWQQFRIHILVARVMLWMPLIVFGQRWRRNIVGTSPYLHLFLSMFLSRLRLVQSLQCPVVSLIQSPTLVHWQIHLIQFLQYNAHGFNGTFEYGCVDNVEFEVVFGELLGTGEGFLFTCVSERNVCPSSEFVEFVPSGFSVADKD